MHNYAYSNKRRANITSSIKWTYNYVTIEYKFNQYYQLAISNCIHSNPIIYQDRLYWALGDILSLDIYTVYKINVNAIITIMKLYNYISLMGCILFKPKQ